MTDVFIFKVSDPPPPTPQPPFGFIWKHTESDDQKCVMDVISPTRTGGQEVPRGEGCAC